MGDCYFVVLVVIVMHLCCIVVTCYFAVAVGFVVVVVLLVLPCFISLLSLPFQLDFCLSDCMFRAAFHLLVASVPQLVMLLFKCLASCEAWFLLVVILRVCYLIFIVVL